eukprot:CAMPEP_0194765838 /NCGR_PEP_ID=MMETSP0323_2-20130528/27279_1 /TAXON_ID=2866 ORGANISM="Crypthecodinium cohnii, Strain Seligo" /NCGR_SAMPLE_ID=MMETSP0323_2 /ASSEMBLY_ACC=CAM_ASM_000346 /LENGTH=92 /DNA_ID=CAMNT_0039696045 /DNA_START=151 /DNA_END=430 /DNA_ORIENTATION=-
MAGALELLLPPSRSQQRRVPPISRPPTDSLAAEAAVLPSLPEGNLATEAAGLPPSAALPAGQSGVVAVPFALDGRRRRVGLGMNTTEFMPSI